MNRWWLQPQMPLSCQQWVIAKTHIAPLWVSAHNTWHASHCTLPKSTTDSPYCLTLDLHSVVSCRCFSPNTWRSRQDGLPWRRTCVRSDVPMYCQCIHHGLGLWPLLQAQSACASWIGHNWATGDAGGVHMGTFHFQTHHPSHLKQIPVVRRTMLFRGSIPCRCWLPDLHDGFSFNVLPRGQKTWC